MGGSTAPGGPVSPKPQESPWDPPAAPAPAQVWSHPNPTQGTPDDSCTLRPGLSPVAEGHLPACVWGRMMCFESSCGPIPGRREFSPGSSPSRCTDQGRVREGLSGRGHFPPGMPVRHSRVGGGTSRQYLKNLPAQPLTPGGLGSTGKTTRGHFQTEFPPPCPSPQPAVTTKAAAPGAHWIHNSPQASSRLHAVFVPSRCPHSLRLRIQNWCEPSIPAPHVPVAPAKNT